MVKYLLTRQRKKPKETSNEFCHKHLEIDNTFNSTWKRIGFNIMLRQAKFSKRSGPPAGDVVYLFMLWFG
jgi:hypothetical protein